jgi:hypothetical protein
MLFLLFFICIGLTDGRIRLGAKIGGRKLYCNITCQESEVCYEFLNTCFPKCKEDADCGKIPTVLHYPNTGVCEKVTGKCYDCLTNEDCKPYRNETCNAKCIYNFDTFEYLCGNGNFCPLETPCEPKFNYYQCSLSSLLLPFSFLSLIFYIL